MEYIKPTLHTAEVIPATEILACSICDHNGNHYGHHKHNEFEEATRNDPDPWQK